MIKLYGHEMSGNSYKPRLLLELLNIEYEWVKIDLMKGEHKSPEYLVLKPFGQVPLLLDGDTKLADAQAILVYLARQYGGDTWLPLDAFGCTPVGSSRSLAIDNCWRNSPGSGKCQTLLFVWGYQYQYRTGTPASREYPDSIRSTFEYAQLVRIRSPHDR